jgi:Spy/CpxP family protein refolding chaperone
MKRHLRAELNLTPQQMEQISPIVDRAASELEAKREQTMREVRNIFEETHRDITPFLTAEQQRKLVELEQRHRRRLHRHGFMPPPGPPP